MSRFDTDFIPEIKKQSNIEKEIHIEQTYIHIYIHLHFFVIQAQQGTEQSGQCEEQDNRHKDRGDNFFEVTSRGDIGSARSGPTPLRVLGNS